MGTDLRTPVKILLNGLTGEIEGKSYSVMVPMKNNDDQWIADVLTYVRENLGDGGRRITPGHVKRLREIYQDREAYWTIPELEEDKNEYTN